MLHNITLTKTFLPSKVNSTVLNDGLSFQIILVSTVLERLGRDSNNVLLVLVLGSKLRLDAVLPLVLHEFFDASLAKIAPLSSQSRLADTLEGLIDEDTTAQATWENLSVMRVNSSHFRCLPEPSTASWSSMGSNPPTR